MPKISDIEETPNPNAVKFVLREPVTNGAPRQFKSAEDAAQDPLGKALFDIGQVVSVFYMDRMVTVEKEETADWDDLLPRLAVPIRAAESATNGAPAAADAYASVLGGALAAVMSDDP
ncbi:MAG TPA: NifU N-terminal domain-containing protein, partial [Pyrinomonadaceae bacterium]|nr:NifU N-terminal domain-containing protein [Pyrinomonadaceae bacterium]